MMWMWFGLAVAQEPYSPELPNEERERFFMPAVEGGVLFSADPDLGPGLTFRTALDWRLRRIRAPFLRLSYDATSAPFVQRGVLGAGSLTSDLSTDDVVLGGGFRMGPRALQVTATMQGGVQIASIPTIETQGKDLVIGQRSEVYGLFVAGLGLEWYFDDDAALTVEGTGRISSRRGLRGIAGGVTVGVTTAL
ncbi:MAG: hypothetical protein AAGA48_21330 [Myxococcota bacterium]